MIKTYTNETMHYKITLIDHYGNKHTFYQSTTEYLSFRTDTFRSAEVIGRDKVQVLHIQLCEKDCCRTQEQSSMFPMSK